MRNALLVLVFCAALSGCMQPMKPTTSGHLADQPPAPAGTIPPPVQALPTPPRPKPTVKAETYTVVVHDVDARELLFALARDARLNIDIHPQITGKVTLNAINQTLPQLLNRISKQVASGMRYEFDGANLVILPDSPFLRIYKIDYVNLNRQTSGQVSVSSEIIGTQSGGAGATGGGAAGATSGGGGGGQNSSRISVTNTASNVFWGTLVNNISAILGTGTGATGAPTTSTQATGAGSSSVISNPEASVLNVRATAQQHERIQEFLDQVLANASRQVIIEATIVEVELNNTYQQGIDWAIFTGGWQLFGGGLFRGAAQALAPIPAVGALTATPTGNAFVGQYNSNSVKFSLQLLETFGNVRVLSSPRISAINNQTAILKVVQNVVYFNVSSQVSQAANAGQLQSISTTPQTVPVGIILNVTPQISATDSVLLNVKPSISRIQRMVRDPNPQLTIPNEIPQIVVREMESVIRLSTGQIAVMGGLIQDSLEDNADTIPGVNRLPFFGDFFSNKNIKNTKTELVIFMRPTVIRDPSVDGDYHGYRVFLPGEDFMSQPNPGKPRLCDPPNIEGCPR